MSRLSELMERLATIGRLKTERRPGDPIDARRAAEVRTFLDRYPFLRLDAGYVEFLEQYGATVLWRDNDLMSLDVYGFSSEISTHLVDGPGSTVENGFLTFCDIMVPRGPGLGPSVVVVGGGLGFDATGEKRPGVYRLWDERREWFCESFLAWLERFIERQGQLFDP